MNPELLKRVFDASRKALFYVGVFSFFINLLYLSVPLYMLQIYDRVLTSYGYDTLIYLTIIALFALITLAALDFGRSQLMITLGNWLNRLLAPIAIEYGPDEYLGGNERATQSIQDIRKLQQFVSSNPLAVLFDTPWIPVYMIVIFMLNPFLGVIALISGLVLFLLAVLNESSTKSLLNKSNESLVQSHLHLTSTMRNAETIQAMGMMSSIKERWIKENEKTLAIQAEAKRRSSMFMSISKFARLVAQVLMLGVGAFLVVTIHFSPGGMIAATILLSRALAPIEQSITAWTEMIAARDAYYHLDAYFKKSRSREVGMSLPRPQGFLTLEKVFFYIRGLKEPVLQNINFNLEPGEVLTIIGPTASGKTSLARLIVGVLPASNGVVRLDGADVYRWKRDEFGKSIGYLPQSIELFVGTVKENIARMGEADPQAVVAASKLAGCHEMILKLEKGYDTVLADQGRSLSGGQRQRIALARALYGSPRLIVLDEPNSSLDETGQQALLSAIAKIKQQKVTTILITHLPNLIDCADKLLLLQEGRIVAFGPKEEVLRRLTRPHTPEVKTAEGGAS